MKSLDELREWGKEHPNYYMFASQFDKLADGIEAEIAEYYMPLPLDADWVPIHVGDVLGSGEMGHEEFTVDGIGYHDGRGVVFHMAGHCLNGWNRFNAGMCRHVKPRTIEDVLRDYYAEVNNHLGEGKMGEIITKYAAEIREVLGVSE